MVPHRWMIKALKLIGSAANVIALLEMIDWKTELVSGDTNLGEVNINQVSINQGDSLSPLHFIISLIPLALALRRMKQEYSFQKGKGMLNHLLFMDDLKLYGSDHIEIDSLVRTVEIVTKDIGMKFGIDKCGVLTMKWGREVKCDGIESGNGREIDQVGERGYKYLGILEKRDMCQDEINENVRKEYFQRLRATLKSKLNAKHVFQAIKTWVVPTVRYSAGDIVLAWIEKQERLSHLWWTTSEIKL